MLEAVRFRVQNFLNIDDSGWIPLERVTAFVGRNESGKTALLKALHKFNPATPERYNAQREFPRDRYTRDFKNGADWPVCSVAFKIKGSLLDSITQLIEDIGFPEEVIITANYDNHFEFEFTPPLENKPVKPDPLIRALKTLAAAVRRLKVQEGEDEEIIKGLRTNLATWATKWQDKIAVYQDLQNKKGIELLSLVRDESDKYASPETADMLEKLQAEIVPLFTEANKKPTVEQVVGLLREHMPVFIYFEDYGILKSNVYLPRFLEDLDRIPDAPQTRTINAMFKHVKLTAKEISELGVEEAQKAIANKQEVTPEIIAADQQRKEKRSIMLNSASIDISSRFNNWYGQRRHTIEYQADGDYFRIWVADDRRPNVKIELEDRSKGFQWFFSFYLVFLVESDEGHKDAILLLDEPGLHLHPTAQQELICFFEELSKSNQLIYTTHSPFLIDGDHIHRVRPVTEDDSGHSRVSVESWPKDRDTIFPLQAAAGYAMVKGLFRHKKNVLVEGMSDYYYLHALSQQCLRTERFCLPNDIYITPCGGTKLVGHLASLFLGLDVRPIVVLDGDDAGRIRRDALLKELYAGYESAIILLNDVVKRDYNEVEIEDILGEEIIIPVLNILTNKEFILNDTDRAAGGVTKRIKVSALRQSFALQDGWKASVAIKLVSKWAEERTILPDSILDEASSLFELIYRGFEE